MDLNQIRYFVVMAEELNFTRAAARLGISQPALTKAIRKLEDEVGGVLIHRDGKDTRLTELGRTLRPDLEIIASNVEKAHQLAGRITRGEVTTLNFGLSNTLGGEPTMAFIKSVSDELMGANFVLHDVATMNLPSLVLSGGLDCGICSDCDISSPKLKMKTLFEERLLLACSRSSPLAALKEIPIEKLRTEFYIDRLNCEFRARAIAFLGDKDVFMAPRIQADREDWVQKLIEINSGVALLPEFSSLLPDIILKPVQGLNISRKIQFISVSGPPPAEAVRVVERLASRYSWPKAQ